MTDGQTLPALPVPRPSLSPARGREGAHVCVKCVEMEGGHRRGQRERERERHSVCVRVCVLPLRPCRLLCEVAAVLLVLPDTCFAYRRGRAERRGGWDDNGKMRVPQDVREREKEREIVNRFV